MLNTYFCFALNRICDGKIGRAASKLGCQSDRPERGGDPTARKGSGQGRHRQGEVTWVVMVDPEGNEFRVLVPWKHPQNAG